MKIIVFLICFYFCTPVFSKSIKTENIISVADSILVSKVGEDLKKYFTISDEGSHYKYFVSKNKIGIANFISERKITRDITEIWILYHFNYPQIAGMKAGIWMKFDSNLQLIEEPILNAVPDFLIQKKTPDFISNKSIQEIALKFFSESSFNITEPKLHYVKNIEKYVYSIGNKVSNSKNKTNIDEGKLEVIEIEAFTGKVIKIYDSYHGLIDK